MNRQGFIRKAFLTAAAMPLVDLNEKAIARGQGLQELEVVPDHAITYDLNSLPADRSLAEVMHMAKTYGIIIYDSRYGGQKPSFVAVPNEHTIEIDPFVK